MSITTLYVPTDDETATSDYIDVLHEALFTVDGAVSEIRRGLAAINELRPATAAAAIGQALSTIRHALTAVDLDTLGPRTAPDPIVTAVAAAVAAVPFPACPLYDPADTADLTHGYDAWHKHRLAAARQALDDIDHRT